jgi:hypothetical protein
MADVKKSNARKVSKKMLLELANVTRQFIGNADEIERDKCLKTRLDLAEKCAEEWGDRNAWLSFADVMYGICGSWPLGKGDDREVIRVFKAFGIEVA